MAAAVSAVPKPLDGGAFDELMDAAVDELLELELLPSFASEWLMRALREMPPSLPRKTSNLRVQLWLLDAITTHEKKRRTGHPPETAKQKLVKWTLIGACMSLIDAGTKPPEAAKTVAGIAGKLKIRTARGGKIHSTTIYDWWRRLGTAPGPRLFVEMISVHGRPLSKPQIVEATRQMLRWSNAE